MILRQSTATSIILGPFLDETDGRTPEESLTVTSIEVDLYKGVTKVDIAVTASGGSNDMAAIDNGYYSLELTASDTNTIGPVTITANVSGALPLWKEFIVVDEASYDSLILGTAVLPVNMIEINSETTPVDNIEAAFDGTGYAGGTIKTGVDVVEWDGTAVGTPAVAGYPVVTTKDNQTGIDSNSINAIVSSFYASNESSIIFLGAVDTSTNTTVTFDIGSGTYTDDYFNGALIVVRNPSTELKQARLITDWDDSTSTATIDRAWNINPDNTYGIVVYGWAVDSTGGSSVADIADAVWDEVRADHTTSGTFGEGVASVQGNVGGDVVGDVQGNVNVSISSLGAGSITSATFATGAIDSNALASSAVDKIWDAVLESTLTFREAMRLFLSALTGLTTGGGTSSVNFRDVANSKNRIAATVDSNGNRVSVTRDGS